MRLVWRLSIVLCSSVLAGASTAADSYVSYKGSAVSIRSKQFLYGESHVLAYSGDRLSERVVLYTCRDGSAFARKTVSYVDPLAPDFSLDDQSTGMREGIRSAGSARSVYFRRDAAGDERSAALPRSAGLVADSGFDEFIRLNWQRLIGGQSLPLPFLVPSRLNDVGFQVARVRSDRVDGVPVEVFRLKVDNLLSVFLPSIDAYYSAADRVLVRYVGLSDLRDAAHDNFKADIFFPPQERKASDAVSVTAARRAPLAACR